MRRARRCNRRARRRGRLRLRSSGSVTRGCFITGTDTGVGKTVLAAAITVLLRARGVDAVALKPVVTGLDEAPDPDWPPDHELLARVSECAPNQVNAIGYRAAVSPHLAAELEHRPISHDALVHAVLSTARRHDTAVVEGVGGLLVPLGNGYGVADLARAVALPLVIVARPGLGTINHTLLTLEAARSRELTVAAVVLNPWPDVPETIHRSNRETIEQLGAVEVCVLPSVERPLPEQLLAAAAELPLDRWLS